MRHAGCVHYLQAFQLHGVLADVIEQPHAAAKQHRDQVNLDLVQQPGPQAPLDGGGARQADGLRRLPPPRGAGTFLSMRWICRRCAGQK
jgi:hypothetical protein